MRLTSPIAVIVLLISLVPLNAQSPEKATVPTVEQIKAAAAMPFRNPALPIEQRVDDLVSRMTLEEKVSQLIDRAAAIPRLDVPEYNWWNEGLHGIARSGYATMFPQAIGMAATWDTDGATGGVPMAPAAAAADFARADAAFDRRTSPKFCGKKILCAMAAQTMPMEISSSRVSATSNIVVGAFTTDRPTIVTE